jgi:hypothetical protein
MLSIVHQMYVCCMIDHLCHFVPINYSSACNRQAPSAGRLSIHSIPGMKEVCVCECVRPLLHRTAVFPAVYAQHWAYITVSAWLSWQPQRAPMRGSIQCQFSLHVERSSQTIALHA